MQRRFVLAVCMMISIMAGCANRSKPAAETEKGFTPMFNGKDFAGWTYAKNAKGDDIKAGQGYQIRAEDGVIYSTNEDGGRLMSVKEYGDFDLRFEFKLTPNANNGIGIRCSADGNPAYRGMEIQILDDKGPKYHAPNKELRPAQYHGSIYDVIAAKQGFQKPVGEWNEEEIIAKGHRIKVILNGTTIVDADLNDVKDAHVLAKHPGLHYPTGHIALLGHGSAVEFRNFRIKAN